MTYREVVVMPASDWASPQRYYEDDIVRHCRACCCEVFLRPTEVDDDEGYICVICGVAEQQGVSKAEIVTRKKPQ